MSDAEKYVSRGYAPGNYCCICKTCNGQFIGEKRSWCCLGCAKSADRIEQLEREAQLQAQEIDKTRRRADKWQSMVLDCEKYLKPGETPRQRMDRDHADVLALLKLLEAEKRKAEQLEAERDAAHKRGLEDAAKIASEYEYADVAIYAIRAKVEGGK